MMDKFEEDFSYKLYPIFSSSSLKSLFRGLHTRLDRVVLDGHTYILTITDEVFRINSYPVSINTMIFDYSKDELVKIKNRILRSVLLIFINACVVVFKAFKIDTNVFLNNYIFSTNFFSKQWESLNINRLTTQIVYKYKRHAVLLRSVNEVQNQNLCKNLLESGWIKLVSRQVYIFRNWDTVLHHHNTNIDLGLLNSQRYLFKDPNKESIEDFKIAEKLYNKLYLDKYSQNNIQYTAEYLRELYLSELITLKLLVDTQNNITVGVVGMVGEGTVITAPIVGYDTDLDKHEALYRRIIIYIIKYAMDNKLLLNLSSGASNFKTMRGAEAHLEYMFVYTKHLPAYRRFIWWLLSIISIYLYGNLLQRLKL